MALSPGNRWGVIGIVLLALYFAVSIIVTAFISADVYTRTFAFALAVLFGFLAIYSGVMARRNGAKVFGTIDILLGIAILIFVFYNFIVYLIDYIKNLPTF